MLQVGTYPTEPPPLFQRWAGWVAIALFLLLLSPWMLIAGGLILVGGLAVARGDAALIVCLPAGLALLVGVPLLFLLNRRWHPSVVWFEFDGSTLKYAFPANCDSQQHARWVTEIVGVERCRRVKSRTLRGYIIRFQDRSQIFIPRGLTHADELYEQLKAILANRDKSSSERSESP